MKKENPEHSEEHKKTKNKEMVDLNEVEQVENLRDESVFVMVQPRIGPKKKRNPEQSQQGKFKMCHQTKEGYELLLLSKTNHSLLLFIYLPPF